MKEIINNIINVFKSGNVKDIVIFCSIILVPVLVLILLAILVKMHSKQSRKQKKAVQNEPIEVLEPVYTQAPAAQAPVYQAAQAPAAAPAPAPVIVHVHEHAPAAAPAPAPAPAAREAIPVKTTERVVEKVKVKVNVAKLSKLDKSLLAATGIFCVGLGAMLQRSINGKR